MKRTLLLAPLSFLVLFPGGANGQTDEPVLTGRAAAERIVGNTMVLTPTNPDPAISLKSVIYFSPDGRAAMQITASDPATEDEKTETEAGNWSIDDQERLCVVEEGDTLRDRDCVGMRVTGDIVQSVPEDVLDGATATLVEGNPYGL